MVEHALTRSVRDSAAVLDATAGPDLGDPYSAPPPARRFSRRSAGCPALRVAFTTSAATAPGARRLRARVQEAAKLCEDLGHDVSEATLTSRAM